MKRVLCVLVALVFAGGVWVYVPAAVAEEPSTYGWWYRLNTRQLANPIGVEPTHPGVPEDGMLVAKDLHPDEPLAIAALSYSAAAGPSATLELEVSPNSILGTPLVAACPTTQAFFGEFPGRWEDRPIGDCDLALTTGELLGDGESMVFDLPKEFMVFDEFWNFVLVPDPQADPFEIAFERPGPASFSVNVSTAPPPSAPPPPPPAPVVTASPETEVVPVAPVPEPQATPVPTPAPPEAPVGQAAAPPLPVPADDTAQRVIAAVVVALLAAGVWAMGAMDARRAAARAGGGRTPQVRGIGRFAKPRSGRPPRLVG